MCLKSDTESQITLFPKIKTLQKKIPQTLALYELPVCSYLQKVELCLGRFKLTGIYQ